MKMAKASKKDMEASLVIMGILTDIDSGYFPRLPDPDAEPDENEPTFFDEDDPEHLRIFYDRIKKALDLGPGCMGRVIGGFHTLMHNDIVDPDLDHLELHPRIVAALATAEEAKPVPEDQRSIAEQLAATPGRIEYCSAGWSRELPDDQGYWWWWNEDGPPIPVTILFSGTDKSYFASVGQHGWNRAQSVKDMGGLWMRLMEPQTP